MRKRTRALAALSARRQFHIPMGSPAGSWAKSWVSFGGFTESRVISTAHGKHGPTAGQRHRRFAVLRALQQKLEKARRLRATRKNFGSAKARGCRDSDSPEHRRGRFDRALPARSKVREIKHPAALPYAEFLVFMPTLREQDASRPADSNL